MRRLPLMFALVAAMVASTASAEAQKLGRSKYTDSEAGYLFRPLKDWEFTPIQQGERSAGTILKMSAGKPLNVKLPGNQRGPYLPSMYAFLMKQPESEAVTGGGGGGLRKRVSQEEAARPTIEEMIEKYFGNLRDFKEGMQSPILAPKDEKLKKKLVASHSIYRAFDPNGIDLALDCWTISLDQWDVGFVWLVPEEDAAKYLRTVKSSMKTLELVEIEKDQVRTVAGDGDYESFVTYQKAEAAKTPGWQIVEVPSKRFLLLTSADNKKFINLVIERLEKSRNLYEKDFPPMKKMPNFVSVVRVCSSQEEMQRFSGMGPGTAGYFSPSTKELVLYDASHMDRAMTLAVMSHEAFHQYCHFLFDEAEAHRWFDEGQGDYYGAHDFSGRKPKVTKHMPGGLDRLPGVKEMLREGSLIPISRLIRMNHEEWYGNNSRYHGVASYCQSWALMYFLRQGMVGEVSGKYWKKEYADIVPRYTTHLFAGFAEARAQNEKEFEKKLEAGGGENNFDPDTIKRLRSAIHRVGEETKNKIWNKAMGESWGKIDMEDFENNWLAFIKRAL